MTKLTVAIVSGGLDSSTMLFDLLSQGHSVEPMFIGYGQRHRCERLSAHAVVRSAAGRWSGCSSLVEADIDPTALFLGSSQTDRQIPVPVGAYDDPTMQVTVVPNRNMLLLSMAGARAASIGADAVAYGAHAGDHAIYPDCRAGFVEAMGRALALCHYRPIELLVPYLHMSKADIVRRAVGLEVPVASTWTCYVGERSRGPCGRCGACDERRSAFAEAGVTDPCAA